MGAQAGLAAAGVLIYICRVAELILYAIPAFVLLLVVELLSFKYARDEDLVGYEARDTRTSLTMGGGNVAINAVWKLVVVAIYAGLYELTPLRMPADMWWTYALLFLADDFAYYWFHRIHHEMRLFWASHVVHHSSQHYNLSTALRQTWTPMTALPFWAPLALLGFAALDDPHPAGDQPHLPVLDSHRAGAEDARLVRVLLQHALAPPRPPRLQRGLPRPQLRRHPDRLGPPLRHLPGETEKVRYGLTQNIRTFKPTRVAFHEFIAIAHDVRHAKSWRERCGYLFRGPGWSPDGSGGGTRG